jgi:glycine/serine hydroxymethyltransferase
MKEPEVAEVGRLLSTALRERAAEAALAKVRTRIAELAAAFPAYPADFPGHV